MDRDDLATVEGCRFGRAVDGVQQALDRFRRSVSAGGRHKSHGTPVTVVAVDVAGDRREVTPQTPGKRVERVGAARDAVGDGHGGRRGRCGVVWRDRSCGGRARRLLIAAEEAGGLPRDELREGDVRPGERARRRPVADVQDAADAPVHGHGDREDGREALCTAHVRLVAGQQAGRREIGDHKPAPRAQDLGGDRRLAQRDVAAAADGGARTGLLMVCDDADGRMSVGESEAGRRDADAVRGDLGQCGQRRPEVVEVRQCGSSSGRRLSEGRQDVLPGLLPEQRLHVVSAVAAMTSGAAIAGEAARIAPAPHRVEADAEEASGVAEPQPRVAVGAAYAHGLRSGDLRASVTKAHKFYTPTRRCRATRDYWVGSRRGADTPACRLRVGASSRRCYSAATPAPGEAAPNGTTRSRPCRLARYIAQSALSRSSSTTVAWSGKEATPMLTLSGALCGMAGAMLVFGRRRRRPRGRCRSGSP